MKTHDKMRTIPVTSYQHIRISRTMLQSVCSRWWLHSPTCGDMKFCALFKQRSMHKFAGEAVKKRLLNFWFTYSCCIPADVDSNRCCSVNLLKTMFARLFGTQQLQIITTPTRQWQDKAEANGVLFRVTVACHHAGEIALEKNHEKMFLLRIFAKEVLNQYPLP